MLQNLILRVDSTLVQITKDSFLRAGLMVNESIVKVAEEYESMTTKALESRLSLYLSFLKTCIETNNIAICSKSERACLDTKIYSILQLTQLKFSPLPVSIQSLILEICRGYVATISFVTHNKFVMKGVMNLIKEMDKEQSSGSLKKITQDLMMVSQNFAGMDFYEFNLRLFRRRKIVA
jgi:hypothetical protein